MWIRTFFSLSRMPLLEGWTEKRLRLKLSAWHFNWLRIKNRVTFVKKENPLIRKTNMGNHAI